LDVSEKTARKYIKEAALPSVFIGGAYRVSEEDLEEYLRSARVKPRDSAPKAVRPSLEAPEEDEGQSAGSIADRLDWVTEEVLEPIIRQRHVLIQGWRDKGVDALQEARCGAFEMANSNDGIYFKLQRFGADEVIKNQATASPEDLDAALRHNNAYARLLGVAAEASNVVGELTRLAGDEAEGGFEAFEEMLATAPRAEAG
jgi:excisionase family DNA binding protein